MRLAATAAVVAVLVAAAGCGGDDEETTTGETSAGATATGPTGAEPEQVEPPLERQDGDGGSGTAGATPRAALESFFTSGDPDLACGELATERLLSSAYGDEMGCRQAQVPAAVPDSIEVVELEDSGDEANATVIPDGGPNDGIETEVTLVNEEGAWLVDSLEADVPAGP